MKIINSRVLTVTGIAALFLALAGSVHAIPFSIRDTLDSGIHWGNRHNGSNDHEVTLVLDRDDHRGRYQGLTDSHAIGMDRGYGMIPFHQEKHGHHPYVWERPTPPTPKPNVPVANVPDGGSTALMVGLALMGLTSIRKLLPV